jgi:predicted glycoside hydrolase/deacetylase ChbG (UPF0249 family)
MRRLIVNADDLGLAKAVNAGVEAAHTQGIVTAASVLVTGGAFEEVAELARRCPRLDLGLHWNLSLGLPAGPVGGRAYLRAGRFHGAIGLATAFLRGALREEELIEEGDAQVARFRTRLGDPSHLDLHQHLHLLPPVRRAAFRLARRHGIPFLRWPVESPRHGWRARLVARSLKGPFPQDLRRTDHFRGLDRTGRWSAEELRETLLAIPPGLTELMVHPGAPGGTPGPDRLHRSRPRECEFLCDPKLRAALDAAGILLTSFRAECARAA